MQEPRINDEIKAREVRLIGVDGQQLGVISLDEALRQAERAELDLVEVSPDANPPVCKIFDYGKYRFEQGKREKEAKKKQHVIQIKEIKFRPKIDTHDYETKRNHIHRFLTGGNKVKVTIMYRGREMDHIDIGRKILDNIIHELEQVSLVEASPKLEGRNMVMTLAPKKS